MVRICFQVTLSEALIIQRHLEIFNVETCALKLNYHSKFGPNFGANFVLQYTPGVSDKKATKKIEYIFMYVILF